MEPAIIRVSKCQGLPPERMIKRLGSPTWRGRARQITQNRVAVTEYGTSILPKAKMGRLIWFTV